jgi:hypothetical protein
MEQQLSSYLGERQVAELVEDDEAEPGSVQAQGERLPLPNRVVDANRDRSMQHDDAGPAIA